MKLRKKKTTANQSSNLITILELAQAFATFVYFFVTYEFELVCNMSGFRQGSQEFKKCIFKLVPQSLYEIRTRSIFNYYISQIYDK